VFLQEALFRRKLVLLVCLAAGVLSLSAQAQTPLGINQQAITPAPATQPGGSLGGAIMQTLPATTTSAGPGPSMENRIPKEDRPIVDIEGLRIEIKQFLTPGLTVISDSEAQAALEPYLGPNKQFQDLLDAAAALKRLLAGKGYFLADAFIPEQSIMEGIVAIRVLEGRMGKVKIQAEDNVGISLGLLESFLADLKEDSIIETDVVERAVFLLSDLKGVNIRTIFEPGEKVGTANFIVQVSRARGVEGSVDFDANGSFYTGVFRVGAGVDFNNLAGVGDMFSLRYSHSAESRHMAYRRVSYLAPTGASGLKLGVAYSELSYRLGTPEFAPLLAHGKAVVSSLLAAYPVIRTRNANLIVSAQVDHRAFRDRQETTQRFTDKNTRVRTISLGGDIRDALFGGGVNVYNLAHTRGDLAFLNPIFQASDQATRNTGGVYNKTNLTFSRLQSISEGIALYVSYSGQTANKNLDSSEKFSLGGPNGVRAYPQGEASGDEGWIASGELRFRMPTSESIPGTMVVTLFHDAGWARLNKNMMAADVDRTRKIAGLGVGLNWEVPGDWSLRASVASRQTARAESESVLREPRLYVQFTKNF